MITVEPGPLVPGGLSGWRRLRNRCDCRLAHFARAGRCRRAAGALLFAELWKVNEAVASTLDRRIQILDAAAELFATKGVAATTVREIGDAAGVFSGSLYHYFKSKNAIVAELLSGFMSDIEQRFNRIAEQESAPSEKVDAMIRATLTVIELHPNPTAIYQNDRSYLRDQDLLGPVDAASRGIREHWLRALRQGVEQGIFRADLPPEIFYRSVRDTLWSTTHWPDRKPYSLTEFADIMVALFFQGFAAGPK